MFNLGLSMEFSLKCWCYFAETETTPTAKPATTNTVTQATFTPTTGIMLFIILDDLQLFDQGRWQQKFCQYCQQKHGND